MRAIGIAIPFFRRRSGVPIDAQAQVHFNRVIADGGVVPSGLSGVNAFFSAVKAIYGTTDINTAISAAYDAHYLGYKLGAGSGTTLGQAAQKLYAPKGIFGGIGTGSAFYDAPGVNGNFVSTPNAAANELITNFGIEVFSDTAALTSSTKILCSKRTASTATTFSFQYVLTNTNLHNLLLSDGSSIITYASTTTINTNSIGFRFSRNSTSGIIKFFETQNGTTWTQTGADVSGFTGNVFNLNSIFTIGNNVIASADVKIKKANIYKDDTFTTPTQIFNANQYTGANTWTSTTSEVWTVNSTGAGLADVTQTTAASQPLLLAHTGENYWFGSGVAGNFVATASQSALKFNTDFSVVVNIESYIATTNMEIAGSSGGVAAFAIMSTGLLRFDFGGVGYSSTTTLPSNTKWIRFSASGLNLLFYTSNDGTNWTQLGTTVIMSARTTPGNIEIFAGRGSGNIALPLNGKIISIKYYTDSALASLVYNFNPASYNPSVSQTQWSSATGEVWSVSTGTANTGYKAALVTKTIVQGDGVDDRMIVTGLSSRSTFSRYAAINPLNINVFKGIVGANVSDRHYLYATATDVAIYNGVALTYTSEQAQRLALYEADYNGASSVALLNNTTSNTGNAGTGSSTAIEVFAIAAGSNANFILNTLIDRVDAGIDTPTQKTAIYNYLRSINGAAF